MSIILTYQSMLTSSQMSLSLLKKKVFESQCYHSMFESANYFSELNFAQGQKIRVANITKVAIYDKRK